MVEALTQLWFPSVLERRLSIGGCDVPLKQVVSQGSQTLRGPLLSRKGKYRGTLHLGLDFTPLAEAKQRESEAAHVPGTQAQAMPSGSSSLLGHAGSTVPRPSTPAASGSRLVRQVSPPREPVPLPPALQCARWLLDAVSQWPDECLRPERHKDLVHNCVHRLEALCSQDGLVRTRWIQPSEVEVPQQQQQEGGFADVVHGTWQGRKVALKQFRPFQPASTVGRTLVQSFVREVCLLSHLQTAEQHDNIVQLLGFTADLEAGWLGIVLEWVGEDQAAAVTVERAAETATEDVLLQYALDVAEGIRFLHGLEPRIVHRDLTSSNILITPRGRAKLIDVGVSQWLQQTTLTLIRALTPPWMPPEVLSGKQRVVDLQVLSDCAEKCDVYSFGVILGQLATTAPLWEGLVGDDVVRAFTNGARLAPPAVQQEWLRQLIAQCISEEAADRPSMADVLRELQSHHAEGILRSSAPWPVIWPE